MDDKLFNELETNLKEAVDIAKGRVAPETAYFVITPATIKSIRHKVKMSQAAFVSPESGHSERVGTGQAHPGCGCLKLPAPDPGRS